MRIDFYGDLTCPWCHLGWQRLQAALALRVFAPAITVRWRPYQLNPDIPVNGTDRGEYLLRKFGNAERVREVLHAVETAMRTDGIHVNLHRIKIMSNSYLAHRLMLLAETHKLQYAFMNEIFVAYFVQGKDIGDLLVLREIARLSRLPNDESEHELTTRDPHPDIIQSEQEARQMSIRAVPYILFDGKYSIAGAHDPVAFLPLVDLCRYQETAVSAPGAAG